ncbi:MAG: hypothetical protein AAGJ38_05485 [Planctomycetota bacterium]
MNDKTTPVPTPESSSSTTSLPPIASQALKQFIEYHAGQKGLKLDVSDVVLGDNPRRRNAKGKVAITAENGESFTALVAALDGKRGATVINQIESRVQLAAQTDAKSPKAEFRFTVTYPRK